jgi:predicted GNAT family N-acyltransferase
MIEVIKINTPEELSQSHKIRLEVFVDEQKVPVEEEMDEFENNSLHYLARVDGQAAGTARWRVTDKGIKLERFAVKKNFRRSGVGSALMKCILEEINKSPDLNKREIYLHSQLTAMPLYTKFGFTKTGNMFEEAGIKHYKMVKTD